MKNQWLNKWLDHKNQQLDYTKSTVRPHKLENLD